MARPRMYDYRRPLKIVTAPAPGTPFLPGHLDGGLGTQLFDFQLVILLFQPNSVRILPVPPIIVSTDRLVLPGTELLLLDGSKLLG